MIGALCGQTKKQTTLPPATHNQTDDRSALRDADLSHFLAFGFVVLRRCFDPELLAAEIDLVMHQGLIASSDPFVGREVQFRYVPMMTAETPLSLTLLDRLEAVAAALLGGPVLPTRAKGVRYAGNSPWHVDSDIPVPSVGFAAYLEPLEAESGALRLLPGSHRQEFGDAIRAFGADGMPAVDLPGHVVATQPGDIIAFEEHLFHGSFGGGVRRQWRVDYLLDPVDAASQAHTKSYFAGLYPTEWDGGYDTDRYPSYDADWRSSDRFSAARLAELGVYELVDRQEAFARSRR
ncbi:MAG TPA: phytanoyl-CoA dioxygenase family protein [Hydrogenophaga sp.]|nr:phytanoyl-CoA dioxygenase family protein [Hydrogenophaga sp.]